MNEHETHEEVIKLARRELEDHERINCWFRPEFVRALIDRLEAAHKRERGDCAKLHEAMKKVVEIAGKEWDAFRENSAMCEMWEICAAALAATAGKSSAVEDCAKLREALGKLRADLWNNTVIAGKRKFELYEIADAALAAPATAEKSSAVDDCAKLREAVKAVVEVGYPHNFQHDAPHIRGYCYEITRAIDKCFAALATEKEGDNK